MIKKYKYSNKAEFLKLRAELSGSGTKDKFMIGASSGPTVYSNGEKIGLNEYSSPTVFFYECCDFYDRVIPPSLPMTRGVIQEPVIYREYFRHWNPEIPTAEEFLDNYNGEKKVYRTAGSANYIYVNSKYPWLYASPDYLISKNKYTKRGPLELKSPSSRAVDKYEAGVPTNYIVQLYQQMIVMGFDYGELLQVVDATFPSLFVFDKNPIIENNIIESTRDFYERVLRGKLIVHSDMSQLEKEQALGEIAPPDNGSPLYTDYLKERHRPENALETIQGTGDQLNVIISYLMQKETAKEDKRVLTETENIIRSWFSDGIGYVEWPDLGRISWIERLNVPSSILKKVQA